MKQKGRFNGGATHIRQHFLKISGCGVAKCTAPDDKLKPVADSMQQSRGAGGRGGDGAGEGVQQREA
eukprot:1136697-Pelagomonas_calceolata.AAC.7